MNEKRTGRAWVAGAAVLAFAAPWVVVPGAEDAFEVPKRVAWGALGVWLAWGAWRDGCGKDKEGGLWAAWWGLMAWMALRSLAGPGWGHWAAPWMAWAMPAVLFGLAASCRWGGKEKRRLARAVAVSGLLQAGLMACQRWGFDPLWGGATGAMEYAPGRMVGAVGYQNQSAEFLALAAACAVYGWKGRWRWAACGAMGAVIVLTANRGAIAGLAAGGLAMGLAWGAGRGFRRGAVALAGTAGACVLVAAVLLAMPETRGRLAELGNPGRSAAVQSRLWEWRVARDIWKDHVWLGGGGGAYGREYVDRLGDAMPERKSRRDVEPVVYAREAHCDILQYGAEFGIAGLALLGWLAWGVARRLRRGEREDRMVAAGVAAFMGTASLVSFSWQTATAGPLAGFLLGMWCGGREGETGARGRLHAAVLAVVAAGLLGLAGLETARSLEVAWVPLKGPSLAASAVKHLAAGDVGRAVELSLAAERDVVSPAVLRNHGAALAELGRWEEAVEVYGRWARCGIGYGEALRNLSICLERTGRWGEAAECEERRLELVPGEGDGDRMFRLAVLHLQAGETDAARKAMDRFRRLCRGRHREEWTPRWDNLEGSIAAAAGDRETARQCFERALERDSSLESARRNLEAMGGGTESR